MRKYVRHPFDIPIQYSVNETPVLTENETKNISLGGICFKSLQSEEKGTIIKLNIPMFNSDYQILGKVVWCLQNRDGYDLGVQFLNEKDAFVARMIEQLSHIKHYQKKVLNTEGRKLSDKQAALEWIENHAGEF